MDLPKCLHFTGITVDASIGTVNAGISITDHRIAEIREIVRGINVCLGMRMLSAGIRRR